MADTFFGMQVARQAARLARRALPDAVYQRLRRQRLAGVIRQYDAWDREGIYGDSRLTIRIADPLAEGWYGHDWAVLPEIAFLRELGALRPGGCVFDLGAHQGVVALMLAHEVGPDGYVLAVEAEPHNARIAQINKSANHAVNIDILNAAIIDEDGTASFVESLNGSVSATGQGGVQVPAWTVDTLAMTHRAPDLVFMDIEGYEGRALPAAVRTIDRGAAFFVEVHVETLIDSTPDHLARLFCGRDVYIATDPTGDSSYSFHRWHGGSLPNRRFYLIAAQRTSSRARCPDARTP